MKNSPASTEMVDSLRQQPSDDLKISEDNCDLAKISLANSEKGESSSSGSKFKASSSKTQLVKKRTRVVDEEDVPLPQATSLTTIDGVVIPPENMGEALQFLEFCATFKEASGMDKEQGKSILKELMHERTRRGGNYQTLGEIHFTLSSLILKDLGKELPSKGAEHLWWEDLKECVLESKFKSKEIPDDCFQGGYGGLTASQKLKLLNFLCDEALNTKFMRRLITDQRSEFSEAIAAAKRNVTEAKKEEKTIQQNLKCIVEPEVLSKLKDQATEARKSVEEANDVFEKRKALAHAHRIFMENGLVFWRLRNSAGEPTIYLQEMRVADDDTIAPEEKWFTFGAEQKLALENYFSSRKKILKRRRAERDIESDVTEETERDIEIEEDEKTNKEQRTEEMKTEGGSKSEGNEGTKDKEEANTAEDHQTKS